MLPVMERKEEHKCLKQLTHRKTKKAERRGSDYKELYWNGKKTGMINIYEEHYEKAKNLKKKKKIRRTAGKEEE
jgi:hypothetical protein